MQELKFQISLSVSTGCCSTYVERSSQLSVMTQLDEDLLIQAQPDQIQRLFDRRYHRGLKYSNHVESRKFPWKPIYYTLPAHRRPLCNRIFAVQLTFQSNLCWKRSITSKLLKRFNLSPNCFVLRLLHTVPHGSSSGSSVTLQTKVEHPTSSFISNEICSDVLVSCQLWKYPIVDPNHVFNSQAEDRPEDIKMFEFQLRLFRQFPVWTFLLEMLSRESSKGKIGAR